MSNDMNTPSSGPDKAPDEKKIQHNCGYTEIREVAENAIVARGFEPFQSKAYRELTFARYLFSYLNENDDCVSVYFDYDEDNIAEYYYWARTFHSLGHWDRDLLMVSFFGVDKS